MTKQVGLGPGTVRVGRFVGKLGVVSLPSVEAGLGLDQRVVRRHVARLEAAGWLIRSPGVWGKGSVVWLTGAGVEGAGLGGVRAVKSPPAPTTIAHGVLVGWSAARAERRRRVWQSSRELALDPERWGPDALRTRLHRTASRPRGMARQLKATGSGHRRERRAPRGPSEDYPRRVARRPRLRPVLRRAIRLRQPIGRSLDRSPGEEGPAERFAAHRSRADDCRADRRPLPSRRDD